MEEQSNAQSSDSQEDPFEIFSSNDLEEINSLLSGFSVTVSQPQSKSDWTDQRLLNLKGIVLRRYNNATQLATIVKEGLTSLQENVSQRTIGAIMVSAWNLYSVPEGKYVFPEIPTNTTPDDKEFTALDQSPLTTNPDNPDEAPDDEEFTALDQRPLTTNPDNPDEAPDDEEFTALDQSPLTTNPDNPDEAAEILWPVDDSVTCAVGAYVCACLLRLATKPTSNFLKAWVNIKNRYSDLNKCPFEIRGLNPIQGNLEAIRIAFSNPSPFNNTLSRFVYHFNELRGNAKGLARFAFEQHLSLTGLHSYRLFRRVTDKLEANPDDLSVELNSPTTQRGLEMIDTILQKFEGSNDENQSRQTWRYARLFDAQMFGHLQTKNCKDLTSILAMILKEIGDNQGGVGDVSQIVEIQSIPESTRNLHLGIASRVIQKFASKTTRTG